MFTPITTAADFGSTLARARKGLGLTQRELALAIGAGERFIVDLEAGKPTSQLGKALTAANEVGIVLADTGRPPSGAATVEPYPTESDDRDLLADLPRF